MSRTQENPSPERNGERLISSQELATRWGWNKHTPCVLRRRGKMPVRHVHIGGSIRYRLSDVIAYEQERTSGPGGAALARGQ